MANVDEYTALTKEFGKLWIRIEYSMVKAISFDAISTPERNI